MKIIFVVHGLGEYAQAQAVADLLQKKRENIFFLSKDKLIKDIAFNDNFSVLDEKNNINNILDKTEADALFLCNSHTNIPYDLTRPNKIKKIFSLDSNWLFNNKKYDSENFHKFYTYPWIDTIYTLFPKPIFEANLKENGGYYEIEKYFKNRIYCPGFVPSGTSLNSSEKLILRKKYRINNEKKIISLYFGDRTFHSRNYNKMVAETMRTICLILNDLKNINKIDFEIRKLDEDVPKKQKSSINFDEELSVTDLMIMHYGYGTLARIFHKKIPVICFIPPVENEIHSNYFELSPLIKKDAIKHFFFDKYEKTGLKDTIVNLLLNESAIADTRRHQQDIFISGENNLVKHFYQQFK
ncbi:hypothetical protein COU88_02610 [Candidatus Roizmanbacteria bacterium CG10_big_fil_rev_8_21_14_0_10_39_6]|uniref:Glycosyl transferase family 28 C-terminal domain-containing protein n=1 Tax=Candidatus Roizmanbacteria bacterium CG10_big_fil_rev_8_21_14_0_10_39_6 TaxID=1974853 RepID=A0A2M8KSK0_9BACT|nr:MAG: hypothetical protein COU88_02610 [Candidatus Roizmanbacteria bacterium CG10_big_fil_rev_8_21_14_0_10_39_6]